MLERVNLAGWLAVLVTFAAILWGTYAWAGARTTSSANNHGPKPLDFLKSLQWCATMGHWLGGFFIVFVPTFWARGLSVVADCLCLAAAIAAAIVVGAAIKEFYFDLHDESDEDVYSSLMDYVGWLFGAELAWGSVVLAHLLGVWR